MANITYSAIQAACLSALDAEGSQYYLDTQDIIPAVNKAQLLLMDMLNKKIGQKKFNEEKLRGIILNRIYQSSIYSRLQIDTPTSTPPISVFSIISVVVNPNVVIPPSLTATPYTIVPQPNGQSAFIPTYTYFSGGQSCTRLNSQERFSNSGNPMMPGFISSNPTPQNTSYGYVASVDYQSEINPNILYEIEIIPKVNIVPVAITFLKIPTVITNTAQSLDFSTVLMEWITEATLAYLAVKGLEGTTLSQESKQFLSELFDSIM